MRQDRTPIETATETVTETVIGAEKRLAPLARLWPGGRTATRDYAQPRFVRTSTCCSRQNARSSEPITILVHHELRSPWNDRMVWIVP